MMPRLISERNVVARKPHPCMTCGEIAVNAGEVYRKTVFEYDGCLYDWIKCEPCAEIFNAVWDWVGSTSYDEGINANDYREWAEYHVDDPKHGTEARAYLTRIEER